MSHVAYDLQLFDAMNDLKEQVKVEHVPVEVNDRGFQNFEDWDTNDEFFQHYAVLYIKYIDIYRKLEECYDQMVHPQKRIFIKKTLESTIIRICETKKKMVEVNPRKDSIYVHLDSLLFDLKYDPSVIEIPVPRYFKEDDRIDIDLIFKEKVDRGGKKGKKGKKKAKKKGKKGKKKKDDDDEKKEEVASLDQKDQWINDCMEKTFKTVEPMEEIVHDPFTLDMDVIGAIRLIQKNERGRAGRYRYNEFLEKLRKEKKNQQNKKQVGSGKGVVKDKAENEEDSAVLVQCAIRGILARKDIQEKRMEEMKFLGMMRAPKTQEQLDDPNDPIKLQAAIQLSRQQMRKEVMYNYEAEKNEMKTEIQQAEENDIIDHELKKRQDWIQEYKENHNGKPPDKIDKYDLRLDVKEPLSPEEEAAAAAAAEEKAKKKGDKKKGDKKKGDKKKGDKKKGKKDAEEKTATVQVGPTEVVQKFNMMYEDYENVWAKRDETENQDQMYDKSMMREEVLPEVQKSLKKQIDDMLNLELDNMRMLMGIKPKKGKKKGKKGKKGKKKKGKKGPKLPGAKLLKGIDEYDMLIELVKNSIVKKLPPAHLKEFLGEFNYIAQMMDDPKDQPRPPSMALIRQLVTEYIIFPLGSSLIRKRHPEEVRSFLFYGPAGTGKTRVVRSVATETRSIVYDLSPLAIQDIYNADRKEGEKMVAMVMMAAKKFAPSLIYLDECDKIFAGKKKKKKGEKRSKKKTNDPNNPARIKKALLKWKAKWITDETRITCIGCSSEPHEGSKKDFKKFFDKAIYFPFPDYTTRRLMWKTFIEREALFKLPPEFPLSTLAHISEGYAAGSIEKTCKNVLTEFRKTKLEQRPLALSEFIGPLSLCGCTDKEGNEEFKKFTDMITGDKARRDKEAKELDPSAEDKKDKKGGGKKGGKKKK